MKIFFRNIQSFLLGLKDDERIPTRDKKTLAVFLAMIIIPLFIIPTWSSSLAGLIYTFVFVGIITDYFFNILDHNILLSHYPWDMKSFASIKRLAQFLSKVSPSFIMNRIWCYKKEIF